MTDSRIINTYVWHDGKCFFVSTIERDSSAELGPRRYNETIVFSYDCEKREQGEILDMGEASTGSIREHQRMVESIFKTGSSKEKEDEE